MKVVFPQNKQPESFLRELIIFHSDKNLFLPISSLENKILIKKNQKSFIDKNSTFQRAKL